MKTLLVFAVVLAFQTIPGRAQSPSPTPDKPALPVGPLIKRAPDFAQWTITYDEKKPPAAPSDGSARPQETPTIIRRNVVTKTGKMYRELETDSQGRKWEKWQIAGQQITFGPDSDKWLLSDGGVDSFFYTNFGQHDFPDFLWISPQNYIGAKKIAGIDCYTFRDEILLPGATSPIPFVAAVATETLLPVLLDIGGDVRTYAMGTAPKEELVLPPKALEIFQARQKAINALSQRPKRK